MTISKFQPLMHAVAAATLLLAPAAQAKVVYSGSWDPLFGPDLPNLGWRATAKVDISDACLAAIGTNTVTLDFTAPVFGGPYSSCYAGPSFDTEFSYGGLALTDVTLDLYEAANPSNIDTLTLGFYDNQYGADVYDETQTVLSASFVNGQLTDFQTSASFRSSTSFGPAGGGLYDFSLVLTLDPASSQLIYLNQVTSFRTAARGTGPTCTNGIPQTVQEAVDCQQVSQNPATVTLKDEFGNVVFVRNAVPEPGSILLTLTALAAGLQLSRRRRA